MAFWRGVVVKLWATIIGMVTIVLILLTLLLGQFLEGYYSRQQSDNLLNLADRLAYIFQTYPDKNLAVDTAGHLLEAYQTSLIVHNLHSEKAEVSHFAADPDLPRLTTAELLNPEELSHVHRGGTISVHRSLGKAGSSSLFFGSNVSGDMLVVAVPYHDQKGQIIGSVILYQSLKNLIETTNGAKWYILYAAGIAIIMTTVFAFFLSTRITRPVLQMKKAADQISQGNFQVRVPIRTTDEIGELAKTFNRMAEDLETTIKDLSKEKEQLSSILNSMTDGVFTVDEHGKILITNPPVRKMLYHLRHGEAEANGEAIGLPEPLIPLYQNVLREGKEQSGDVSANGRTWSVAITPLYRELSEKNQGVRGAVAVLRDVTEERKLDKLRNDFVANISHELRTPIAMLQGYSEAIIDNVVQTQEEQKALVRIIHDESLRMGKLVNELLDLARMESGQLKLQLQKVNIVELCEHVLNKFERMAEESNLLLELVKETPIPAIQADEDRLEQVFTNLVDNALRHTPDGGKVTLRMQALEHEVLIEVEDTGVGIPTEDLPFVFERFYKTDKARTRGKAGTGLGLAIVKNIIEAHGGMITAKSQVGKGTTFSVVLPFEPPQN